MTFVFLHSVFWPPLGYYLFGLFLVFFFLHFLISSASHRTYPLNMLRLRSTTGGQGYIIMLDYTYFCLHQKNRKKKQCLGALVPTGPSFLYNFNFTKSKTAAMGTRHGVVLSWSSSVERVFGRPGDIREKLHKEASALPNAGPAETCCGEHDHEHPRQRHRMGRNALHCLPGNF